MRGDSSKAKNTAAPIKRYEPGNPLADRDSLQLYARINNVFDKWPPFPLNGNAQDLMMGSPTTVLPEQLADLHIRLVEPAPAPS